MRQLKNNKCPYSHLKGFVEKVPGAVTLVVREGGHFAWRGDEGKELI